MIILTQQQEQDAYSYEMKAIVSKLLLNLLYKSNNAIAIFNKQEVNDELKFTLREIENLIDKINIKNNEFDLQETKLNENYKII